MACTPLPVVHGASVGAGQDSVAAPPQGTAGCANMMHRAGRRAACEGNVRGLGHCRSGRLAGVWPSAARPCTAQHWHAARHARLWWPPGVHGAGRGHMVAAAPQAGAVRPGSPRSARTNSDPRGCPPVALMNREEDPARAWGGEEPAAAAAAAAVLCRRAAGLKDFPRLPRVSVFSRGFIPRPSHTAIRVCRP